MAKITLATLKSFIKKNEGNLYIKVNSNFDGMTDCIEIVNGEFKKAIFEQDENYSHTLGYSGIWIVGGSRDYITAFSENGYQGFHVSNCCGSSVIAIRTETDDKIEYRKRQFEKVANPFKEYPAKIKIIKPDGETNWLNISEEELQQIKAILLKEVK